MGLFGGSKEIHVASTVYNMAGDEVDRPQYLKSLVIRNILSGTKRSMGDTVTQGYLSGPGIRFRSFFRWAENNYQDIGLPEGNISSIGSVNASIVAPHIPVGPNQTAWVQEAWIDSGDYGLWVEQWFMENAPELIDTEWTADIDDDTGIITITFEDESSTSFTPTDYVSGDQYLFAYYTIIEGETDGPVVPGNEIEIPSTEDYPNTTGWTLISDDYEDPPGLRTRIWERITFIGNDPDTTEDTIISEKEIMYWFDYDDIPDSKFYRIDTQKIIHSGYSPLQFYIYKIGGSIPEFNDLVQTLESYGQFFPIIPIRHESKMLSPDYRPDVYELAKKAYRKATDGGKYDKVSDEIADHEDVDDIDFTYVVFGVSLNVIEKSCRRYIYNFFERLMASQAGGQTAYDDILTDIQEYNVAYQEWLAWKNGGGEGVEPVLPDRPSIPTNTLRINTTGPMETNYDIRLIWTYIHEEFHTGIGRTGAKRGDFWFEDLGDEDLEASVYSGPEDSPIRVNNRNIGKVRLYWQIEDNEYKYLDIVGMVHRNYIYGGKHVEITAREALDDGEESGFIVPLHYGTYRSMRLVDATQMSTACMFLVFNSYEIVKKKWWETWFFKIILVVAIAVVSVVFTGGAGIGLLGSHFAVGGALGFSGMTAAIVGSVANSLAALVLVSLIEYGAIALFGEQFGAIIGAVIGFVVMNAVINFHLTGAFNFNIADLMKADNLLKLTNAASNAYSAYVQGSINDMQAELEQLQEQADAELKRIREMFISQFGYGGGQIDPLMFVGNTPVMAESRDTFLTRTLMTGSDIAELSHDLLNDFADLTLTLPNAFT